MIINLRGTSGSGKTHTARSFLEYCSPDIVVYGENDKPVAHCVYFNMMPVYFLGTYANVCGGCDTIRTQDLVCSYIRHFSQFGHVIFEGLIISHTFSRYAALWKELTDYGMPFVFAYMDTPLEICIDRVKARRLAKGNMKPLNTANTESTHRTTWITMDKFKAAGIDTVIIKHKKDPVMQIINLLDRDKDLLFEHSYKEQKFT
jgi:hypothetical protein